MMIRSQILIDGCNDGQMLNGKNVSLTDAGIKTIINLLNAKIDDQDKTCMPNESIL